MNCEKFENLISGYLDGELSDAERKECEAHISSCEKCAASLEEYSSLEKMLKESESPLPDEGYWAGFDARMREKVDKAAEKAPWWNFFLVIKRPPAQWLAAAVTLMIIVVFGMPILMEIALNERNERSGKPAVESQRVSKNLPAVTGSEDKQKTAIDSSKPSFAAGGDHLSKSEGRAKSTATPMKEMPEAPRSDIKPQPQENIVDGVPAPGAVSQPEGKSVGRSEADDASVSEKKRDGFFYSPEDKAGAKDEEYKRKDAGATTTYAARPPAISFKPGRPTSPYVAAPAPAPVRKCLPAESEATGGISGEIAAGKFDNLLSLKGKAVSSTVPIGDYKKNAVDSGKYLASSEVVLLKIVNMNDNPKDLAMLKTNLKSSNFIWKLDQEKESNVGNPAIEKHAEAMKEITATVMTIESKGIPGLKHKVIESGILEVTRELKK